MLGQVVPVADPASLLDMVLMSQILVYQAEAGHVRNLISLQKRPILVEDLIRNADIAMMLVALRIRVGKPDALSEAPFC